ncbi:MAG: rhodanese-like domain-containing protein [Pseudomonadota bacterium]
MHRILALTAFLLTAVALAPPALAAAPLDKLLTPTALTEAEDVIVLDIRAAKDFQAGHIEGAVNMPYGLWRGPRNNPGALITDTRLTALLQQAGISPDSRVVVVNEGDSPSAFGATARVYWTLKSAGLVEIAILNGGLRVWGEAGLELTKDAVAPEPTDATFTLSETWAVDRKGVSDVVEGRSDALLIDARPDIFFKGGEKHPAARLPGTLRSAVNLIHESFFGKNGRMTLDAGYVRDLAREAGWTPGRTVVSFCNTGHWAASNWFALSEIAGIEDVKLYPESMVGWQSTGS